ncbi:hypothetical protein QFZ49_008068 [Streptomyces turgidiscabies]|uniref:Transposase IS110-like N-terminal domain-containing protein n=1 Tax=Streptomyces turgidiscabies TaxID=85558 RepID=A0ABU0S1K3_9ACTN|nr:hypothetical protein [Streptomyces turgidiscabies]
MSRIGAGTDCGKTHHHCLVLVLVLDSEGDTLLSCRVANDEPELLKLIGDVLDLADGGRTTWALGVTGGEPGLLIALLVDHGQELVHIPGIAVNRATDSYRGACSRPWNGFSTSVTSARWCCRPDTRHRPRSAAPAVGG